MPLQHNIFQVTATPGVASAAASAELPAVEPQFTGSGVVRGKACGSVPCLHVRLAALASVTAVALLVFFCARVYGRRAFQDFGGRRLASSEDGDPPVEACGNSGDGGEEEQHGTPPTSNWTGGTDGNLPFKKRKLPRVAGTDAGSGEPYAQEQAQLQQHHATAGPPFDSSPPQAFSRVQQYEPSGQVGSQLFLGRTGTPAGLDAAAGRSSDARQQHSAGHFRSKRRQTASLEVRQLLRQKRKVVKELYRLKVEQLEMQKMRQRRQRRQKHLREQSFLYDLYRQQQHMHWRTLHGEQQEHQQPLLQQQQLQQPSLVQQHWQQHLQQQEQQQLAQQQQQQQQTLLEQQVVQHVVQKEEVQRAMQQGPQQVTRKEEHQQKHQPEARGQRKRKKRELQGEKQEPVLQPAESLAGPSLEDEWIAAGSPEAETLQPTTSQQALQSLAPAGAADPLTFERFSVTKGLLAKPLAISRAAAGASSDATGVAPAAGTPHGSAAAQWPSAVPPSGASRTAVKSIYVGMPIISTRARPEGSGIAAVASSAGAVSSTPSSVSTPTIAKLLGTPSASLAAMLQHPFARLPTHIIRDSPSSSLVDLGSSVNRPQGIRSIVPLLQEAHDLLLQQALCPPQLKQLRQLVAELSEHAAQYQSQDVSHHPTFRAVERLAIRYLMLDALVSAYMVLGRRPDEDEWKRVTEAVAHNAPFPSRRSNYSPRANFSFDLCQELSNQIQILKTGKRPEPADLLRVKRMLFCMRFSPAYFKGKDFDPWRKDDNCDGE